MVDKDAILPLQGHDVGHRPECNQVEPSAQVEIWERPGFQKSVAELENDANATEVAESGILGGLWIDDCNAVRQLAFRFVVIKNDDIRAPRADIGDFSTRTGPAIDCDEKLWLVQLPATRDSCSAETVTLLRPRGQEECGRATVGAKYFVEQRQRCHTVDVVIAIKNNPLAAGNRAQDSIYRRTHIRKQEGIT